MAEFTPQQPSSRSAASLPGLSLISSLFNINVVSANNPESVQPGESVLSSSESTSSAGLQRQSSEPEIPTLSSLPKHLSGSKTSPALLKRSDSYPESPKSEKNVMFSIPEPRGITSEECSREGSFVSGSSEGKKRKRSSKPKTSYSICHPPRSNTPRKIQVRAKPLLQLHQIEAQGRPKPAFELLPFAIFSTKLTKAINKVFGERHTLVPTDLAIVRAEEYHNQESLRTDDDESRDVLALICGIGRKDSATNGSVKIMFADGKDWEARQLPNGNYECCITDDHGLKHIVRWWQKKPTKDASVRAEDETAEPGKKFNFSTISQSSRRHPVIANLTATTLDIHETYNVPTPVTSTLETPPVSRCSSDDGQLLGETATTTKDLRNLITATSVYVAIREGWCAVYRGEDSLTRSASIKSVTSSRCYATPPTSPRKVLDSDGVQRTASLRNSIRPSSMLRNPFKPERPSSTHSDPVAAVHKDNNSAATTFAALATRTRARAGTTSTVIVNANAGQWRPDFEDTTPEDEAEEDNSDKDSSETEAEDEEQMNQGPAPTTWSRSTSEKRDTRSNHVRSRSESRKVSDSTVTTSESDMEKEKGRLKLQSQPVKEKKKKSKFLSKLLCGMV